MAYVRNGAISLALEERGSGPAHVLFAHGWISARRMWFDVADRLDPQRYTLHLLDFRGAGLSDRPSDGHDLDGYASDLRAALAAIPGEVTVVAHSMGGKVAQYVALEPPSNFARMILVAPGSARSFAMDPKHRALAVEAFGSREKIERFQRSAMTRPLPPATMERIVNDALVAHHEHWFGWYDKGRTADFSARLGEIRMPTFVLGGDKDPLAPVSRLHADVASKISGAVSITLRGVGHNLPVEAPDEVATLITRVA
jgi:pimeloyl-ACP methyl ester carboxylesterase